MKKKQPANIMTHFVLDVIDMTEFRSILPANPKKYEEYKDKIPKGVSIESVINISITEHFPWDDLYLKYMLERLFLIGDVDNKEKHRFNNHLE
ncbi:hypothetical protein [Shouchella patagoniensis]|uniref:hypothetical protein n=1 Tax=Shouchella patagoniensis TaxID=228576 RepID=UPI000995CA50|nr:hypothetical protein [Shouchella patagoniensis]